MASKVLLNEQAKVRKMHDVLVRLLLVTKRAYSIHMSIR